MVIHFVLPVLIHILSHANLQTGIVLYVKLLLKRIISYTLRDVIMALYPKEYSDLKIKKDKEELDTIITNVANNITECENDTWNPDSDECQLMYLFMYKNADWDTLPNLPFGVIIGVEDYVSTDNILFKCFDYKDETYCSIKPKNT